MRQRNDNDRSNFVIFENTKFTRAGLNTVNLGSLTAFQQALLGILLLIGNVIFVSLSIVITRLYFYRRKLAELVEHSEAAQEVLENAESQIEKPERQHASPVVSQLQTRAVEY